jgi:hypothetical protein
MSVPYHLDKTYEVAKEGVERRGRSRHIDKSEQRSFFLRHANEMGELYELIMVRAMMGYDKFGDLIFHMTDEELETMKKEELADAKVYDLAQKYRHELFGDNL